MIAAQAAGLRCEVDVEAPPEQVFAAMTDWSQHQHWMLGTRVEADGVNAVGTELHAVTGVGAVGLPDTMRITEWDPPRICRVEHIGRIVRGTAAFEVLPTDTGSHVVWSERLDLPLGRLGRLGWPLIRPAFAAGVRLSLRRLARWAPGHRVGG